MFKKINSLKQAKCLKDKRGSSNKQISLKHDLWVKASFGFVYMQISLITQPCPK